ncbi:hypothetical protein KKE60_04575 [Patescibacteria group bacterium]|nr:hypothetical protein [Patescibacteria group bacterium]
MAQGGAVRTFGPLQSKIQAQRILDELARNGSYHGVDEGEFSSIYARVIDGTRDTIRIHREGTRQWVIIKETEEV